MDDNLIIELYWQRNQLAVSETEIKYGPYCRSIAYGILQNNQDTEECVNDTWLRAWDSIPPQRPARLSAFLGRIARNLALDRYDYNHAAKRSGPFDQLLSEEGRRNLFLRRYWYCESIEELGKRYRMTQSAVKSSLFRTRNKLKAYLEKEGVGIE